MTQRPITTRSRLVQTAATMLLMAPVVLVAGAAEATGPHYQAIGVYPRASVSSDAYRTPPHRLTAVAPKPITSQRRAPRTSRAQVQTPSARQTGVRPIAHEAHDNVQTVSRRENRKSVRDELQRLYAEEGRQMPQMTMPSYPAPRAEPETGRRPVVTPNSPNGHAQSPPNPPGLLTGIFDFGRSRSRSFRSRSEAPTQPPVEPNPFRPPTYRQPVRQQRTAQTPAKQTPPRGALNQQSTAQTKQSSAAIELKRVTPRRGLAAADSFFPEDDHTPAAEVPPTQGSRNAAESDLAEFFPEDVSVAKAAPRAPAAADHVKEKMKEMLSQQAEKTLATADEEFKAPVTTEEEIIPTPAPAAVSDVVTTRVTPEAPGTGLPEPAPFFADDERAIDPNESLEVAVLSGQTFDPSGADSAATAGTVTDAPAGGSRMQQIRARDGVGLKGYCPVALRDERRLADGKAAYVSYYRGKTYHFSSSHAKAAFDNSPAEYAPASMGEDVALKTLTGEVVEGSLDFSVWYKNRLYLFSSDENLKTFMAAPAAMAVAQ